MGKIADSFLNWIKNKYIKKGLEWNRSDDITWKFWAYVFPFLILIPLLFWALKKLIIDYLLAKKGFNTMVAYAIIILILRPMIMDFFVKLMTFKEEVKKSNEVKI